MSMVEVTWRCANEAECVCNERTAAGCNMSRDVAVNGSYVEPPLTEILAERDAHFLRRTEVVEPPPRPPETILDEALSLTSRTRKDVYAHPSVNFDRIAKLWSVILGVEVTPTQHALCMIAVKLSRLVETPEHRDSLIDIAGYARTIELLGEGVEV